MRLSLSARSLSLSLLCSVCLSVSCLSRVSLSLSLSLSLPHLIPAVRDTAGRAAGALSERLDGQIGTVNAMAAGSGGGAVAPGPPRELTVAEKLDKVRFHGPTLFLLFWLPSSHFFSVHCLGVSHFLDSLLAEYRQIRALRTSSVNAVEVRIPSLYHHFSATFRPLFGRFPRLPHFPGRFRLLRPHIS